MVRGHSTLFLGHVPILPLPVYIVVALVTREAILIRLLLADCQQAIGLVCALQPASPIPQAHLQDVQLTTQGLELQQQPTMFAMSLETTSWTPPRRQELVHAI